MMSATRCMLEKAFGQPENRRQDSAHQNLSLGYSPATTVGQVQRAPPQEPCTWQRMATRLGVPSWPQRIEGFES